MKEKKEFTILRYLGRPPALFNDDAIAAVAHILETAGDNFNWDTFTEYATFHKLSQTLYPNMLTYGRASCPPPKKIPEKENNPLAPPLAKGRCQASPDGGVVFAPKIPNKKNTTVGAYLCVCPIPDVIIRKFRGIFLANAARNEFLAQELVKINRLLEENGIQVLNWKGPTLALQAFGDLSLRQFKDLDTFVKQKDLEKAKAVLLENGFADITPQNRLPEYSAGRGYEFFNTKKCYELELEYSIFLARSVLDYDYDGMFDRASSVSVDNKQIKTLSIEDNLLFTSFHGTKHLWFRLRWLADMLGKFELHKDKILSQIDTFEQKQLIAFSIYIAHKEFNLEESANFTNLHKLLLNYKIKDLNKFEKIIHNRILQHNTKDTPLNHYWKAKIIANLITGDQNRKKYSTDMKYFNLRQRVRKKIVPSQADYDLIKLPKLLWPLYFVIRPYRVAIRELSKVITKH